MRIGSASPAVHSAAGLRPRDRIASVSRNASPPGEIPVNVPMTLFQRIVLLVLASAGASALLHRDNRVRSQALDVAGRLRAARGYSQRNFPSSSRASPGRASTANLSTNCREQPLRQLREPTLPSACCAPTTRGEESRPMMRIHNERADTIEGICTGRPSFKRLHD